MSEEHPIRKVVGGILARADSWANALTGLGNVLRDKRYAARIAQRRPLTDPELDILYHQNDLAAAICDKIPEEMLREGFRITTGDGEEASHVMERWEQLEGHRCFVEGMAWGRLFGGGAIYTVVDDGALSESEPMGETVNRVIGLEVLDRRDIIPSTYYDDATDLENGHKYGKAKTYSVTRPGTGIVADTALEIHESRLITFGGAMTSERRKQQSHGWDDSVLFRVHEVLRDFEMSWSGAAVLMSDMSQAVFKIHGLLDLIASGEKDRISERMEIVDMSRSVARAVAVDAELEDFERKPTPLTGVHEMLELWMYRVSAAARMPATRLFGRSPAGMNASGESDDRGWYDFLAAEQRTELKPRLKRFFRLLLTEGGKSEPREWDIKFNPLWTPTAKEQAEIRKLQAETDVAYIKEGVLLDAEVATSRFTPQGWSGETQIDLEARQEILKAEKERAIEMVKNTPTPPTDPTEEKDPDEDP